MRTHLIGLPPDPPLIAAKHDEPVVDAVRVGIVTGNGFRIVQSCRNGEDGSLRVYGHGLSVRIPQEGVEHVVRIDIRASDGSPVIDVNGAVGRASRAGVRGCSRSRSVERSELTIGSANVAMVDVVRVGVDSRDDAELVQPGETTRAPPFPARLLYLLWELRR